MISQTEGYFRLIKGEHVERATVICDPNATWEYECQGCHQLRFVPTKAEPIECGNCGHGHIVVGRPGTLGPSVARFLILLQECVDVHGYQFQFVANTNTCRSSNPTDLRSFGAVYWKSSTGSLWGPVEVVNMLHFRSGHPIQMFKAARQNMNMDPVKASLIRAASLASDGYNRCLRRRILKAVYNCQRAPD